jgi:hypothetical protein
VLVLVATAASRRRVALVILGVLLACVAVPVLVEVRGADEHGIFFWRARYTLPLAVGIPILAGLALASETDIAGRVLRRLATILAAMFLVASWIAFARDGQRLTVGALGPLLPWDGRGWSPPVPLTLLELAYLGLLIGLVVLAVTSVKRSAAP